ncbi:hypothetical protein FKM82_018912 [Ascaphus truei]
MLGPYFINNMRRTKQVPPRHPAPLKHTRLQGGQLPRKPNEGNKANTKRQHHAASGSAECGLFECFLTKVYKDTLHHYTMHWGVIVMQ